MIGVEPDGADDALREVRRAMFSTAVLRAHRQGSTTPMSPEDIGAEVQSARQARTS